MCLVGYRASRNNLIRNANNGINDSYIIVSVQRVPKWLNPDLESKSFEVIGYGTPQKGRVWEGVSHSPRREFSWEIWELKPDFGAL